MSDWISYNELLNQGIKNFELLEHLREGLQPYSRPNKPIYCPYHYHRYEYLSRKHSRLGNLIEFLKRSDITEEIFLDDKKETKFILIRLDEYLRESIKRYNSEVTSEYRIQIYDHVFVDPHAQSENLSKFINCLKKKREETLKEIEDIVDEDPNLNEDQRKLSWKYLIIPDSEEKYNNIVLKLKNAFFKKDDVNRFVKKNGVGIANHKKTTEQDPKNFSPEIIDLMKKARPEIDSIYKAIKEGEGFNSVGDIHHEARREDALNYFKEYKDKYKIIEEEDLQDIEIFRTSAQKNARKVKGELLKRIVRRHNLGDYPYSELFIEYQKTK